MIAAVTANRLFAIFTAVLMIFTVWTKSAHDIWAATAVYMAILILTVLLILHKAFVEKSDGIHLPLLFPAFGLFIALLISYLRACNPGESYLGFMDWTAALIAFYLVLNFCRDRS